MLLKIVLQIACLERVCCIQFKLLRSTVSTPNCYLYGLACVGYVFWLVVALFYCQPRLIRFETLQMYHGQKKLLFDLMATLFYLQMVL